MPLYEYRCPRCSHTFERLVPADRADEAHACPNCGYPASDRVPSIFGAGRSRCGGPGRPT
ncbi:MAG: zinc ribbon domain-containing protein [Planctomycetes bacterium]|nr:zinc ribbon domain-containing protein [Planctomycetota bacterium]